MGACCFCEVSMKFRVDEIVAATAGRLAFGRPDALVSAVVTDTRALAAGQGFLALRGDQFDGHNFLDAAVNRGASALIIDREDLLAGLNGFAASGAVVVVRDTEAALAALGRAARARLKCPVLAVTGSCGKTTVKEMVGQILGRRLKGKTPPASFNNQIGVPLTLLAAGADDQFVLCEFGTNHPGEIAHLAGIGRPTVAIVTVVAEVHLEGLISLDGVAAEKSAIVEAVPPEGLAILNADDPRVAAMARKCRGRVITVGLNRRADLQAANFTQSEAGVRFTAGGVTFEIPVLGEHQVVLALASAAAAREMGVSVAESSEVLRQFHPPKMRLAIQNAGDVKILNDAYNANPRSMKAALGLLPIWPDRRKVVFFGDMRELGAASRAAHEDIGRVIAGAGVARLACVGPESAATARAAVAAGMKPDAVATFADAQAAAQAATGIVRSGDMVLVKGSRLIRMEKVVEAIAES
jgi:UDP-N-acetylmuramoyl-tripeptide--D-alanyl-D-alanine ligase